MGPKKVLSDDKSKKDTKEKSKPLVEDSINKEESSKNKEKPSKTKEEKPSKNKKSKNIKDDQVDKESADPENLEDPTEPDQPILKDIVIKKTKARKEKPIIKEIVEIIEPPILSEPFIDNITNSEFLSIKDEWVGLSKEIEELNKHREILELKKNTLVTKMYKIIEETQPKLENILEKKTLNPVFSKNSITSKLLENESSDSESSDSESEDRAPKKKMPTKNKKIVDSSSDDSD